LRSAAYFHGDGAGSHLTVLLVWTLLGFAAIVIGHHSPIRFAAHPVSLDEVGPDGSGPDDGARHLLAAAAHRVNGADQTGWEATDVVVGPRAADPR
jgi:hypothetical protein